ncbi:MAG: TRAP transporter large permease subunit [Spirochaetaceae bacterium]|jgi:tripartite ATP-independent transporter DctM subunit|nr:TRAP transporter large permease subunit [Spirochaetaceae bacterium]
MNPDKAETGTGAAEKAAVPPPRTRFFRGLLAVERFFCYASLVLLALLPVVEVILRKTIKSGLPASSVLMTHLLLTLGLFSGMMTTREKDHLSVSLVQYLGGGKAMPAASVLAGLVSAFVATALAWCSLSFVKIGLSGRLVGFIPDRVFGAFMPLAYAVMAVRFARQTPLAGRLRLLAPLAIVLGTVAAFPAIVKCIWGFDAPDAVLDLVDLASLIAWYIRIPSVVFFAFSALAGTPLFVVIAGLALFLTHAAGGEIDVAANEIYAALTQNSIIAIPLFTLAGFLLSESRAGERLVAAFRSFFSWMPGGMIIASVVICAFFTSFTGASGVTILALGGILYSILSEYGRYRENFSIGLLTSVGSIGLLFPPSLPIILVGAMTQTNILHLFAGGLLPGIILVLAVIVLGIVVSMKTKIPREPFSLKHSLASLKQCAPEALLPVFLIAGFFSGFFTLVEIGAIAVLYTFVVEVLIHREIRLRDLPGVFFKAVPIVGGVLSILAASKALSHFIVDTQAPDIFARWLLGAIQSRFVFLLLLNLALLVVGCLMDIFSAILIVMPLVMPLGAAFGLDPVHLGIIFIVNLEVGFLTPPVGLNLFLAAYRFKKPFVEICRDVFPFLLIQLAVVILVTYIPEFSTFLPRFF